MSFDEWLEANREELENNRDDYEVLYKAWFAGYQAGLEEMSKFAKELWSLK